MVGEVVRLRDKLSWFQPSDESAELELLHTDQKNLPEDDSEYD